MAFIYRTENGGSLTPSQEDLLGRVETMHCPFEGISKFEDLRRRIGLSVIISDRASMVSLLESCIKKIDDQIDKYRSDPEKFMKITNQIEEHIYGRKNWANEKLREAANPNSGMPLLGLYTRKLLWFDSSSPVVYLFADNINGYAAATGKNPDNVFGYVFIHEMMHAYYDAFNSDGYPSWESLEEAFAEFGMLTFINSNSPYLPSSNLLADAVVHVKQKILNGPREYGYGYELFDRTGGRDIRMISRYREVSNWIDVQSARKLAPNYFRDIWGYRRDPKDQIATECFKGVEEILKYNWTKPDIIIQPKVRGGLSASGRGSHRFHESEEWAVTSYMERWVDQYPIIRKGDLMQLLAEVLREMKSDGFEEYLSITGRCIEFMGRRIAFYATSLRPRVVPESLCIKGTNVYPAFFMSPFGRAGRYGDFLHAMSILYDGVFTLVNDGSGYTLYGPSCFAERFSYEDEKEIEYTPISFEPETATSITASSKGAHGPYQIIEKSTSSVIAEPNYMTETVYAVINDYCGKHSGISFSDLQRIFCKVSCRQNLGENCGIALKVDADNDRADARARGVKFDKRFNFDNPIILATGEVIVVSNQWDGTPGRNFNDFKDVAESLGYEIK